MFKDILFLSDHSFMFFTSSPPESSQYKLVLLLQYHRQIWINRTIIVNITGPTTVLWGTLRLMSKNSVVPP